LSTSSADKPYSTNRHVWKLAWPTIISNLLFTTVGFAHIKIVAQLGTTSVAAVTTGHRIFFLIQAILMGVSVAATAMIARAWGAGEPRQAELVSWASIVLSVALAAVISIPVLLIPEAIAGLFGLDEESTRLAASFIFWLGLFNVFAAINMMLATALRATGNVITPLWFLLFSSVLNVTGAYLLTFGIGGLPRFGVAGVSLGGSTGAAIMTVFFVIFWWRGNFNLKPTKWAPVNWSIARQLVSIGGPAVIEQGIVQVAFLAFFTIIAHYGTDAYAAYGIGISLVAFSIVIGFGFGLATATIVGQQLGAGQADLAVRAVSRSLRMALAAMTLLSVLLAWFAEELATFMIDDPEVIHLTVFFMPHGVRIHPWRRAARRRRHPFSPGRHLLRHHPGAADDRLAPALAGVLRLLDIRGDAAGLRYQGRYAGVSLPLAQVAGHQDRASRYTPGPCRQRQKKYLKFEL
jgi:Na+-driven multidrug efflux pump